MTYITLPHHDPKLKVIVAIFWMLTTVVVYTFTDPTTLSAQALAQTDYFVSPNGNDANTCLSIDVPCKTINSALSKIVNGDTINVSPGVYQENVDINKSVTIKGASLDTTFIDGNNTGLPLRVRNTSSSITVQLSGFTIRNGVGDSAGYGGAIYNDETLILTNVTISSSQASRGGAIFNDGTLNLESVTIKSNSSNTGSAIYNNNKATINNSTVNSNTTTNTGAINNNATMSVSNSTIYANSGHGGVSNSGIFTIRNSTITKNASSASGGGFENYQTLTIESSTISSNTVSNGGAIANQTGTITIRNSIIADNTGNNCSGSSIISMGYNIDSGNSCPFSSTQDRVNTNPHLTPLGNNGGTTLTMGLFSNSPALDTGDPLNCPSTDQRGVSRPIDGNADGISVCDIGAVEMNTTAPNYSVYIPLLQR